jgi:hypothetical protein
LTPFFTNAEVAAYSNGEFLFSQTESSQVEQKGILPTTSAAAIWMQGCFEPGTGIGLLVDVGFKNRHNNIRKQDVCINLAFVPVGTYLHFITF